MRRIRPVNTQPPKVGLKGNYTLAVIREGQKVEKQAGSNLVVSVGETLVADLCDAGASEAKPQWGALGSGSTVAQASDTALENEFQREIATSTGVTGRTLTLQFSFTIAGPESLNEGGILNAASLGILVSRFLFNPFSLQAADVVALTWSLEFTGD